MFLRIIQHLLPNARAWRLTVDKFLRQFFEGLAGLGDAIKLFYDEIWTDIDPQQTRELTTWENQFGLRDTGLTEQERRDRLDATWKALGGQDPLYIQDTLRASGFDVYVHEWWVPGTEPTINVKSCVTPRNPSLVLRDSDDDRIIYTTGANEAIMEAGEADAVAGDRISLPGYLLVNKLFTTRRNVFSLAGESFMEAGEADAVAGNYDGFINTPFEYFIPSDVDKWHYFLYIGGQVFGEQAQIDPKRRDEFETLCLKICPAQQWLGIIVEYV